MSFREENGYLFPPYTSYKKERKRLRNASKYGKNCTLTIVEWLDILVKSNWSCTYCGEKTVLGLDHLLPTNIGGETNKDNCVPSCERCHYGFINSKKEGMN